jgi:hypothetical protein
MGIFLIKHQAHQDISFTAEQAHSVCVFKVISVDFSGKRKPDPAEQIK